MWFQRICVDSFLQMLFMLFIISWPSQYKSFTMSWAWWGDTIYICNQRKFEYVKKRFKQDVERVVTEKPMFLDVWLDDVQLLWSETTRKRLRSSKGHLTRVSFVWAQNMIATTDKNYSLKLNTSVGVQQDNFITCEHKLP